MSWSYKDTETGELKTATTLFPPEQAAGRKMFRLVTGLGPDDEIIAQRPAWVPDRKVSVKLEPGEAGNLMYLTRSILSQSGDDLFRQCARRFIWTFKGTMVATSKNTIHATPAIKAANETFSAFITHVKSPEAKRATLNMADHGVGSFPDELKRFEILKGQKAVTIAAETLRRVNAQFTYFFLPGFGILAASSYLTVSALLDDPSASVTIYPGDTFSSPFAILTPYRASIICPVHLPQAYRDVINSPNDQSLPWIAYTEQKGPVRLNWRPQEQAQETAPAFEPFKP